MQKVFRSKTCSLGGTSDLTVVAPIKPGLVSALDTVTYKTRAKRVLRALHAGRAVSHEQDLARLMSDAVERVGRIHSVRIAVLEPQDVILLAATFDGAWETYVRTVWQKVACLLDLVFCNTDEYTVGGTSSYEAWGKWLRGRQAETPFLYAIPGVSYEDVQYMRMQSRLVDRVGGAAAEETMLGTTIPTAEAIGMARASAGVDPMDPWPQKPLHQLDAVPPAFRQGLRSLNGLYRLTDLYPPQTPDGDILLRAAQELLPEFVQLMRASDLGVQQANERPLFKDALDWFRDGMDREQEQERSRGRKNRAARKPEDNPTLLEPKTIQAGILESLPTSDHGLMLLLAFPSATALAEFLEQCAPSVHGGSLAGDIAVNLALTVAGLRRAGLLESEISALPGEFVMGMERRAGLLGDVRVNHPRRWRLPARNWSEGIDARDVREEDDVARVEMNAVEVVLQLRLCKTGVTQEAARTTLLEHANTKLGRATPLSIQWMRRVTDPTLPADKNTVEHFGFGDPISNPVLDKAKAGRYYPNLAFVGDALVGYGNTADHDPEADKAAAAHAKSEEAKLESNVAALLRNGSFLVVRKLRQDIGMLETIVDNAVKTTTVDRDTVLAKMMGRWPARVRGGQPLAQVPADGRTSTNNDFHFRGDPTGKTCPFHAHIRRANPRESIVGELKQSLVAGSRPPRIFRRGMSYGEPFARDESDPTKRADSQAQERGLVFMAYNASIAEQFEVVQRWLVGGGPPGVPSAQGDPFLGFAESGRPRNFMFHDETSNKRVRMDLDGSDSPIEPPRPIVRLEWGLYAFAPSTAALATLAARARQSDAVARVAVPWDAERGAKEIARLQAIERNEGRDAAHLAWKTALEDAEASGEFLGTSIWAALREHHGGLLRTAYGVLVADGALVDEVLRDPRRRVSAQGYMARMKRSFGPIFLGMDPDDAAYAREAQPPIDALETLDVPTTFNLARTKTTELIDGLVKGTKDAARKAEHMRSALGPPARSELEWEVLIDSRELVDHLLATFCEAWFGLSPDSGHFARGGFSWTWKPGEPPRYPGHFIAPSRWFFQPHPGDEVDRRGSEHGQALLEAMTGFLESEGPRLTQPVVRAVLDSAAAKADPSYAARTLIGLIMGFVPTVDGVLRRVLSRWMNDDGTLWSLRTLAAGNTDAGEIDAMVDEAFTRAMQLRTVPELIWRTAREAHHLGAAAPGGVDVAPGDVLVLGLASATQQNLAQGSKGICPAFGGERPRQSLASHACPGRDLAMQMMKGFVMALVTSPRALRPGPSASSFAVSGRMPLVEGAVDTDPHPGPNTAAGAMSAKPSQADVSKAPQPVACWAVGDSWLDDILGAYPDLVTALRPLGYEMVNERLNHTIAGYRLEQLADPDFVEKVVQDLMDAKIGIGNVVPPRVLLMSGGGNDLVQPKDRPRQTQLYRILAPHGARAATAAEAIDEKALQEYLSGLQTHYRRLLDALLPELVDAKGKAVPVLIHAYDHPIPDGRGAAGGAAWLAPVFKARGMRDLAFNTAVMRLLIDRLNGMVRDLATDLATDLGASYPRQVHHLKLTGILADEPGFTKDHKAYWADELHPTPKGYAAIARYIAAELKAMGLAPYKSKSGSAAA